MDALYGVRMVGPLAPHAQGFAEELARLGFTTFSARGQLGMAVCLSRWLAEAGPGPGCVERRGGGLVPGGAASCRLYRVPHTEGAGAAAGIPAWAGRGPRRGAG